MPGHHDYTTSRVGFASHTLEVVFFVVCKMQRAAAGRRFILPGVREEADEDGQHDESAEARERDGDSIKVSRKKEKAVGRNKE